MQVRYEAVVGELTVLVGLVMRRLALSSGVVVSSPAPGASQAGPTTKASKNAIR